MQQRPNSLTRPARRHEDHCVSTFRLIASLKRGSVPRMPVAWAVYPTLEAARTGAATLLAHERVVRVMVVRNEVPGAVVEWVG